MPNQSTSTGRDNRVTKQQLDQMLAKTTQNMKQDIAEYAADLVRQRLAKRIEEMRQEVLMRGLRNLFRR